MSMVSTSNAATEAITRMVAVDLPVRRERVRNRSLETWP